MPWGQNVWVGGFTPWKKSHRCRGGHFRRERAIIPGVGIGKELKWAPNDRIRVGWIVNEAVIRNLRGGPRGGGGGMGIPRWWADCIQPGDLWCIKNYEGIPCLNFRRKSKKQ